MTSPQKKTSTKHLLAAGFFILVSLLVFRELLSPGAILFTTDDNIGNTIAKKNVLPDGLFGFWWGYNLLGACGSLVLKWTSIALSLIPGKLFHNWIHAIDLCLASLFMVLFLRLKYLSWTASLIAALTAFWLGTNLTLTYAGHTGKFAVLMFASLSLLTIELAVRKNSIWWSIIAGGAVGGMFLEQQDVALFCGIILGAYALFAFFREGTLKHKKSIACIISMGLLAIMVSGPTVLKVYKGNVEGIVAVGEKQTPEEKWNFCTQWSVPPDEMIDFMAPGYMGWRSGEQEGPYWGRTGQSPGWNKTKQGFRNFRLENVYIGLPAFVFSMMAIAFLLFSASPHPDPLPQGERECQVNENSTYIKTIKPDIIFWSIAVLLSLLLSFGRYFPLYRLFYLLPGISSIRNPNKFLHIFQISIAILSAYGLSAFLEINNRKQSPASQKLIKTIISAVGGISVLFIVAAGFTIMSRAFQEENIVSAGWGNYAPSIVGNKIKALSHAGLVGLILTGILFGFLAARNTDKYFLPMSLSCILVGLVVCDSLMLSSHYIKAVDKKGLIEDNGVIQTLKENLGSQRVVMLTQSGFYNNWLSISFPYHDIAAFNFAQMPRMPQVYKNYLSIVGANPARMWELSAVSFLMAPIQALGQLKNDPVLSKNLEIIYAYNVFQQGDGVGVSETRDLRSAQHVIMKYSKALPKYSLKTQWQRVADENACRTLASPSFDPQTTVLVAPGKENGFPTPASQQNTGRIESVKETVNSIKIKANASGRSCLLVIQKHDPGWKANINGKPAHIHRCNYLSMGVFLEPGTHEVIFKFEPDLKLLWVQLSGMLLCVIAGVGLCFQSFLHRKHQKD